MGVEPAWPLEYPRCRAMPPIAAEGAAVAIEPPRQRLLRARAVQVRRFAGRTAQQRAR